MPKMTRSFIVFTEGVCLFSFSCYNSCLEYKDDSCRKGKLVKPALQVLFTLLDSNGSILGEDSIDFRACACPTRDAPTVNSSNRCRGSNHSNVVSSSSSKKLKASAASGNDG